jgi:integrase
VTIWKPKHRRTYRYRFYLHGQRYEGNTGLSTFEDAKEWEAQEQRRIEREQAGLSLLPEHSPTFTTWAGVYYQHVLGRGRIRRPERVDELLRVVLRFWGAKPSGKNPDNPPVEGEPYHNLRLADPIRDPSWIVKFEQWMAQRVVRVSGRPPSNQTRNHYRSILSRLYRVAMQPAFAMKTGIRSNPFAGLERDPTRSRRVIVTPAELRRWLAHTPKHAQLAIAIAALAPKLRLDNILSLKWTEHLDPDLRYITVRDHKTVGETDAPLTVPITPQLRAILKAAQKERQGAYLIMHRGARVHSIRHAVRTGAEAAGLTYGRDVGGVVFHTIRHSAATLLAGMPSLTEALRASTMGHSDISTTMQYTHLKPVQERPVLARLARTLKLEAIFSHAFGKATKAAVPRRHQTGKAAKRRESRPRRRSA